MKLYSLATVGLLLLIAPAVAAAQEWISWKPQQASEAQTADAPAPLAPEPAADTEGRVPAVTPPVHNHPPATQQKRHPSSIILIPADISKPYDILGNLEVEVKGRDSEAEAKSTIQSQAQLTYGSQVDAIIFYKAEMRVANLLAGYALKSGFKWKATGVAVKFK